MTTAAGRPAAETGTTGRSVLSVLEARGPLVDALNDGGVLTDAAGKLSALNSSLWQTAYAELGGMLRGFLDIDLGATVVAGWCAHRDLVKAGRATMRSPDTVLVPLTGRDVTMAKRPAVEVMLGDAVVTTLVFELRIDVHVDTATGVVRGGRLVELTTGTCRVKATLSCEGSELRSAEHQFDPRVGCRLGDGVPLVTVPTQRHSRG
jgi:hypothetical protein